MPQHPSAGLTQYVLHAFLAKSSEFHAILLIDVAKLRTANVNAAQVVQLMSRKKHTGTAPFAPHGNASLIFEYSTTTSSHTG